MSSIESLNEEVDHEALHQSKIARLDRLMQYRVFNMFIDMAIDGEMDMETAINTYKQEVREGGI